MQAMNFKTTSDNIYLKDKKLRIRKVDNSGRSNATGKYKTAVARVYVGPGSEPFVINGKQISSFCTRKMYLNLIELPFQVTNTLGAITGFATVRGGGTTAQCRAISLAIAIALERYNPDYYPILREHKLTTFINRPVERKKPGQPKARAKRPTSRR